MGDPRKRNQNNRCKGDDRSTSRIEIRSDAPDPPEGSEQWKWYGPGLLWMISSVGSGSVLFTPRVGGRYGYALLWLLLGVVFLMFVMIREIGRYTVVTGRTILDGFRDVPGPWNWAVWLIFLPQLVACIATIAGIGALLGSVLMTGLPGTQALFAVVTILLAGALALSGKYKGVERASSIMAIVLTLAAITAAVIVFPSGSDLLWGLQPGFPPEPDVYFILPWIGFILAGAAGMMWFSYWVGARGYGGPLREQDHDEKARQLGLFDEKKDPADDPRINALKKWIRVMSTAAALGVGAGGVTIVAFLILGTELLKPEGIVPEGVDVAEDLTLLLSEIWGQAGFWLLIISMSVALWGTILSDVDGWSRMFADATIMLFGRPDREDKLADKPDSERPDAGDLEQDRPVPGDRVEMPGDDQHTRWASIRRTLMPLQVADGLALIFQRDHRRWLTGAFVVVVAVAIPLGVFWMLRRPVDILSVGGIVAAIHTPVVVYLTLYLNLTRLPRPLRPGRFIIGVMVFSGLFYGGFGVLHLLNLMGVRLL